MVESQEMKFALVLLKIKMISAREWDWNCLKYIMAFGRYR